MKKKQKTWLIRIGLLLGTIISLFFVPWPIVKALPNTIQAQVNKAPNYGFDGTIVYIDIVGKSPRF